MKTVQDIIFSEEFEQGMNEAVAKAVARADALGLPKAYLDSYEDLSKSEAVGVQAGQNDGTQNST